MAEARLTAHPRPVSPFNWTVFASDAREHHYAHINLVREAPRAYKEGDGFVARLDAAYQPLPMARWETRSRYGDGEAAREAWQSPALGFFRWFADLPAHDGSEPGGTYGGCEWFSDLRFLTPGRPALPFRFGACKDGTNAQWRAFQRADDGSGAPVD